MSKKKKKKAPMGIGYKVVILLCLVVFFGSGFYIIDYVIDNQQAQKGMEKVLAEKTKVGLVKLHKENKDLIGWVKIKGTKIDYPVMQTPGDNEFYLHRNFDKEYSEAGTLFLDEKCVIAERPEDGWDSSSSDTETTDYGEDGTWGWLIYGHHMKYGTMFHDLMKYEDEDFYKKHKEFMFNVLREDPESGDLYEEEGTYQIVSAAYSQIYPEGSDEFRYYAYPQYCKEKKFKEFVKGIKGESIYDTGITPEYGTQLVILSTCAYHTENGRFYIVGAKVDD